MKVDINLLYELKDRDLLRFVKHREFPLLVWNYTKTCQYDKAWGDYPILRQCRGLVTDYEGNIKLRCYSKMYNYEEHHVTELPVGAKDFTIEKKLDGSLLIFGKVDGKMVFTTRGSFYSDACILSQKLFCSLYDESWVEEGKTYLAEIIGPSNRIRNYYSKNDLILHGVLDTETGLDSTTDFPFKWVESYPVEGELFGPELYKKLKELNIKNEEGFVIKVREPQTPTWICKIKFSDYIRDHALIFNTSSISIYETFLYGGNFDNLIEILPDELYAWVEHTKGKLLEQFTEIEESAKSSVEAVKHLLPDQKAVALEVMKNHKKHFDVIFLMLKNKDYNEAIWKKLRPKFERPFQLNVED